MCFAIAIDTELLIAITSMYESNHQFCFRCVNTGHVSSPCCNFEENFHSSAVMEMSCQSNGTSGDIQQSSSAGGTSCQDKRYYAYAPPAIVSGWMYLNEQGQMCGPYIQHQLYEGLSTGFLPDELPVYPIVNGTLINPVPLNYFRQFPDHVATGFAYLSVGSMRQDVQHSAPITVCPDSQLVSQSLVNTDSYISKSNQLMSNCEASTCTTSFLQEVIVLVCLKSVDLLFVKEILSYIPPYEVFGITCLLENFHS